MREQRAKLNWTNRARFLQPNLGERSRDSPDNSCPVTTCSDVTGIRMMALTQKINSQTSVVWNWFCQRKTVIIYIFVYTFAKRSAVSLKRITNWTMCKSLVHSHAGIYRILARRWARSCIIKVKVAHTRLPSVGSRFLAVSLQVTWVINPAVGCHYFPPGLRLTPQPLLLRVAGVATNFAAWWTEAQWVWAVCLRLLPDSVTAAIWTRAFCAWVQHTNS